MYVHMYVHTYIGTHVLDTWPEEERQPGDRKVRHGGNYLAEPWTYSLPNTKARTRREYQPRIPHALVKALHPTFKVI